MQAVAILLVALLTLLTSTPSHADTTINAEPMDGKKVRIDGLLREWPAQFASFSSKVRGTGPKTSGLVGYDDKHLYVAIKTADTDIARTRGAGGNEDHATLYLAFPNTKGQYRTYTVRLYPGDPGKLPGVVKVNGRAANGAKLVEAPIDGGLTIEAQLPWSTFPEASRMRVGLHGALRYTDASSPGRVRGIVGTSAQTSGTRLPPLPLESEQALHGALLGPKGLSSKPAREAYGNVFGSSSYERVAVYGTYLSIVGPGYRGGKEFYYGELPIVNASGVRELDLRDMSGDGKDEIVLRIRRGGDDQYREILQVLDIGSDGAPSVAFAHEIAVKADDVFIENEVSIKGSGNNAKIVVSQGEAKGVDPGSYSEPIPSDMPGTLLPWESVKRRTFEWKGGKMEQTDEESWKPKLEKPTGARASRTRSSGPPAPPPPRPPTADEMLERVYALYRKDRGVGHSKPRFDFVTDVVGDTTPERVLVHGKDIVVFGKGFREGRSYAFIQVGVGKPDDIVDVTARDLTGDGKAEVILRAVMQAKASKELGGDTVERYALLVYKVQGSELVRVFGAEMGRALGNDRILGAIAFEPQKRGFAIELRPARAVGWTEKTYPFPPDTTAAGGLEPLPLPWDSSSVRRYRYDGKSYTQQ